MTHNDFKRIVMTIMIWAVYTYALFNLIAYVIAMTLTVILLMLCVIDAMNPETLIEKSGWDNKLYNLGDRLLQIGFIGLAIWQQEFELLIGVIVVATYTNIRVRLFPRWQV